MKFSVLLSVYAKEKPVYLEQALESVLNQTLMPNEIVLVEDGPLTSALYMVIERYEKTYDSFFRRVPLKKNVGLGRALNQGVLECQYPFIARMDTDDIAKLDRFEKQVEAFRTNPELSLVGGWIEEFSDSPNEITSIRSVPLSHQEIVRYAKRRNPINHMTVMFRRQAVLEAGNYLPMALSEDYYLWYRLIEKGFLLCNLPDILVSVRGGKEMIARRGGFQYWQSERELQNIFLASGFISRREYLQNIAVRFVARMIPGGIREFLYRKLLRKKAWPYSRSSGNGMIV